MYYIQSLVVKIAIIFNLTSSSVIWDLVDTRFLNEIKLKARNLWLSRKIDCFNKLRSQTLVFIINIMINYGHSVHLENCVECFWKTGYRLLRFRRLRLSQSASTFPWKSFTGTSSFRIITAKLNNENCQSINPYIPSRCGFAEPITNL